MGRRKKKTGSEPRSNTIQLMTVSLFIILLAFFILLNSYAVIDEAKKMKALGSLLGSFGILPGGLSAFKGEGRDAVPPTAPIQMRQLDTTSDVISLPDQDDIDMVAIESDEQKEIVTIQEGSLFDSDGLTIKKSAFSLLDKLCQIINRDDSGVEIAGHTDNISEQGDDAGWKLSGFQAMAVARYFIEKGEIDPKSIVAYGCGEYRPHVTKVTKELSKQNRRIDIIINPNARRHISRLYKNKPKQVFTFKKFVFDIFD